ncbi:hypothetical protein [Cupriavidus sp. L7L]|uniref:hypothetical protein n=1 Tax=Cupriavidus sp. L7L TaxID=2546443 RepID=UPI001056B0C6|nr:hypothetical protein [Cupriavidus sp. L7L]TDF58119.1 hypothetical protein E1J61_35655 [Cupriavidus sp. L7L]
MKDDDLTDAEQELLERLPGPPAVATIRATNVWIVEWLHPDEKCTGRLLHEWMEERRPGWSAYRSCKNKAEVIAAIDCATARTQQTGMIPVLHLEAHGDDTGLEGPDGTGGRELLSWDELTIPLQQLNLVSHCNLVVMVAACTGFAGIKAFCQGPRAPAVALVGPDAEVTPTNLLQGTKEFYRRWMDHDPTLKAIAASASQEATTVAFEWEPFVVLAFEALMKRLIISRRPDEQRRRVERLRQRLLAEGQLAAAEIERRLIALPLFRSSDEMQRVWDEMFMIDLDPSNRERFGVDMAAVLKLISEG